MLAQDGIFIAANAASLAMLRIQRPEEFIGKTPEDISPEYQPDGRLTSEKVREVIATAFKQGSHEFEWEHIRSDGDHFIARVLLTPIRQGGKDLLQVVWNDITAQKQAEAQLENYHKDLELRIADRTAALAEMAENLRLKNEEQHAIFDATPVGIILTRNREILSCNRTMEEIFRYEPNELIGKTTRVLFPDDLSYEELTRHLFNDLIAQGYYREERQLVRKDETKAFSSGVEALQELKQASAVGLHYDIVLLDWKMPHMDGVAVAEEIRQLPFERLPLILMVTAYDRDELMRVAAHVKIAEVLSKPVTASNLFNTILHVLKAKALPDEYTRLEGSTIGSRGTLAGVRALLAEDNELNQEVAKGLLKELGITVDVAPDGVQAIDMAKRGNYDVILMDVQMPIMDGIDATIELRKESKFKALPILAMTASVMDSDHERCLAAGMNDHIAKPIEPDQLERTLVKWLPGYAGTVEAPKMHGLVSDSGTVYIFKEAIGGLDVAAGLRRVSGKKDIYVSLLGKFAAGQKDTPEKIREAVASGRTAEAERLSHTLKGVAGNIGAFSIESAASEAERAIRDRCTHIELERILTTLHECVRAFTGAVEQNLLITPLEKSSLPSPEEIKSVCDQLERFLVESDAQASDLFSQKAGVLLVALPDAYNFLETSIQNYDYERALDILRAARRPAQTQ